LRDVGEGVKTDPLKRAYEKAIYWGSTTESIAERGGPRVVEKRHAEPSTERAGSGKWK